MNLTPGELYFIGEDDPADGVRTPFVKIGIVRDDRAVAKRLTEHQTGNPRRLKLLHTQASPAVEEIEVIMRAEFAPRRISGEWFYLPGAELEVAIERATVRIEEARANLPTLEAAKDLNSKVSNGQSMTPDEATLDLHHRLLDVRRQWDEAEDLNKEIGEALLERTRGAPEGYRHVTEQVTEPKMAFRKAKFTAAHPDLAERYTDEMQTPNGDGSFLLVGLRGHAVDIENDNPALFGHLAGIRESLEAGEPAIELHRRYLEVQALHRPLKWERDLLEARLRAFCGEYDEVSGICTWRRKATKQVFNEAALKDEHPDLHAEFSSMGKAGRKVIIDKDLGYRLPQE